MKDTNKTMDNLLDTCKLFAAAILVVESFRDIYSGAG